MRVEKGTPLSMAEFQVGRIFVPSRSKQKGIERAAAKRVRRRKTFAGEREDTPVSVLASAF